MHRSPRVLIAWAIAIVVAIATARILITDLAALHRRAQSLGREVNVVVATRDLAIGHVVNASDLASVARPSSTVASDAVRDVSKAMGRVITTAVLDGDVVRARHFAPSIVPDGYRIMHLVLKDGFRPAPGSIVDVLASSDTSQGDERARTVARAAEVVALDEASDSNDSASSAVTVLVRADEVASVAFAETNATVTIAIASTRSDTTPR